MIKHNQVGAVSGFAVSLILGVLLVAALAFGGWAFSGRQRYKNNVDGLISSAVSSAEQKQSTTLNAQFAQEAKLPLTTYVGPQAYGSITIKYPKTWSAYVDDSQVNGTAPLDGYFAPAVVPSISDPASVFALRIEVLNQPYSQTVQAFSQTASQEQNQITTSAYALPSLPSIVGVELTGTGVIQTSSTTPQDVTMVVLPIRSETLEIWTDGSQYLSDFNSTILKNLTFSP